MLADASVQFFRANGAGDQRVEIGIASGKISTPYRKPDEVDRRFDPKQYRYAERTQPIRQRVSKPARPAPVHERQHEIAVAVRAGDDAADGWLRFHTCNYRRAGTGAGQQG